MGMASLSAVACKTQKNVVLWIVNAAAVIALMLLTAR